ncbi:MAG TPA: 50S ribosomal protein L19 [Spirochaetes bacterium]|nr:50S ribosomal protein L19 [Spirochaetota bacterium]
MITNKSEILDKIESDFLKDETLNFNIGDTVKVHFKIKEGKRERIQVFEGIVISIKRSGVRKTFMVRKISASIGVERIFPFHSPKIDKIEVSKRGRVRRAKLYYLRQRIGKAAQVKRLVDHDRGKKVQKTQGTSKK